MKSINSPTIKLSTGGRVTVPKAIRGEHNSLPGTVILIEETAEGVLLRAEVTSDQKSKKPKKR
jgi:bifunctional DNA-binding transcriptional regulator/antitoxin component of YhaV-PrlF toxin-antitoxin module